MSAGFRDTEIFALGREVSTHRIVTVIGPPGIGKSTLARTFADQKKQRVKSEGGAIVCHLEAARTWTDVAHEVARALGIVTTAGGDSSPTALGERVGRTLALRRRIIVVLDDADRCRAALTKLLPLWTREAPSVSFIITARGRLGIEGERRLEVPPLDVPGAREKNPETIARSPSVALFAHYAGLARPGFRISETNARTVATIVRKLEGIPLAIELCALRMVALSERDIADLLAERLDLLEGEGRSIRSAFALSWDELESEDAQLLAACSVFENGFSLEAAAAIITEHLTPTAKDRVRVAKSLERLVEASLVRVMDEGAGDRERRYTLAETLRAFAREKLAADSTIIEARHAHYFAKLRDRAPNVDLLAFERKNLEKAADRSLKSGDPRSAAAAVLCLAPVALGRGPLAPFVDRVTKLLDTEEPLSSLRAELLLHRGLARLFQGKRDVATDDFEASAKLAAKTEDHKTRALATSKLALITALKGKVDRGLALFDNALAAATKSRDDKTQGIVRKDRANVLSEAGRNDDAVVELGRARKYLRAAGDVREEGFVLMMLGSRFVDEGHLTEARRDCKEALTLLRQAGDRRSEAWALGNLALVDSEEGDTSGARRHLDAGLTLIREVGDEHTEGLLLGFLGNVALEQNLLSDAESAYRDAIVKLSRAGDRASEGQFTAAAAVVDHLLGRHPSARDGIERARSLLEDDGRAARREAVEILATIVEGTPAPKKASATVEEVRFAKRVVASLTASSKVRRNETTVENGVLVIANDGSWVRLESGTVAKLGVGRPIARVMHQLALERFRHPGRPVPPHSLVRAGWPNERVLPAAAKNRLHVTIARLRRVVLETTLLHDDEGYFLDPSKNARLADPNETP